MFEDLRSCTSANELFVDGFAAEELPWSEEKLKDGTLRSYIDETIFGTNTRSLTSIEASSLAIERTSSWKEMSFLRPLRGSLVKLRIDLTPTSCALTSLCSPETWLDDSDKVVSAFNATFGYWTDGVSLKNKWKLVYFIS